MDFVIRITKQAFDIINSVLKKRNSPKILKIGVRQTKWNVGLRYYLECIDNNLIDKEDICLKHEDNIIIVIDKFSANYLNGSIIHWVTDSKENGFKLFNTKEKLRASYDNSLNV